MNIQQLSHEIGIGIDTLRIWERRYGFPLPGRDARGHRRYSAQQLEELRIVKKLQSFGYRPGKIFALSAKQRRALLAERLTQGSPADQALQHLIADFSPAEIEREMAAQLQRLGPGDFIQQFALPMLELLDRGWSAGSLSIAREHLISDRLENLLKTQLGGGQPTPPKLRMLFLTLSGERHKLGLLLAAVLFQQQGADCLLLQEELPLSEVPQLAAELQVDAVALSFSAHYSTRQAKQDLASLRNSLDQQTSMIAGGQAVQKGVALPNLLICADLAQIPALCQKLLTKKDRAITR